MRRSASTVNRSVERPAQPGHDSLEFGDPLVEQVVRHPECAHPVDERRIDRPDIGERQALPGLRIGQAGVVGEHLRDDIARHLVHLVDDAHDGGDVGCADAAVEPFDQLAVVDLQAQCRHRQRRQRLGHDARDLDVVVKRQNVAGDNVDIGLGELAVAALLGTLAAPHLLDLVAPEREVELAGVLQHVARERHGEVEVQAEARVGRLVVGGSLQPSQDVDLLVDLALAQQLLERLDRACLDRREPVQLERPAQRVDHVQLDEALLGQKLGKPAQRGRPGHEHIR